MVWLFGKKIKNISSGSHVIYTTLKLVNSRCCKDEGEDAKEMYQKACAGRTEPLFLFIPGDLVT